MELRKVRGEANPADLFTKHLQSNERIRTLLGLFGCVYMSGRSAVAPQRGTGAWTQKGALLAAATDYSEDELMEWGDKMFIKTVYIGKELPEGTWVPEAFEHDQGLLPHEHSDLDHLFPRASAAAPLGDEDPLQTDDLEEKGAELGRASSRRPRRPDSRGNATTTQHIIEYV